MSRRFSVHGARRGMKLSTLAAAVAGMMFFYSLQTHINIGATIALLVWLASQPNTQGGA